jgi:hypothetical protein
MEEKLMEAVVTDENYRLALAAVKRNREQRESIG